MFKISSKDVALSAVFGKRSSLMGLVMDEVIPGDGNEWVCVIVMLGVHMGV